MAIERTSRRDFLRLAAVAGAAWVAPTLSGVPAAEAAARKNLCKGGCEVCVCGGQAPCSSCGPLGGGYCFDIKGNDEKLFCGANDYCSNLQTCVRKCPQGYKCSWHNACTPGICSNEGSGVCIQVCRKRSEGQMRRMRTPRGTAAAVRR